MHRSHPARLSRIGHPLTSPSEQGVAGIQERNELREALTTLRQLVRWGGLSWDDDALYVVESKLGFPLGRD